MSKLSPEQETVKAAMEQHGKIHYVVVRQLEDLATVLEALTGRKLTLF